MNDTYKTKINLVDTVKNLKIHDNISSIYETKEEQFSVIIPFIKIGLERGEKCIYVVNDNTAQEVLDAMQTRGIDTNLALKSGSLSILNSKEYFTKKGSFEPDWMIQYLKETTDSIKSEGFNALRLTAEMTWFYNVDKGIDRLIEFESKTNLLFPEIDIVAICQYNRRNFPPEIILNVIRTHPIVFYCSLVCKNPYYVPPEELLKPNSISLEIDRLLYNMRVNETKELELKESKDKFKDLFDNATDLIQSATPDGRFIYVNQAWRKTLGYDEEEVSKLTLFDIVHPNSQAHCMEVFQRVISGETVDKIEATFITKEGKNILVEGSANCRFENGKPVNTRAIFRNITDHKLSVERIRSLAHILEESLNEIYIFDAKTLKFIQVNKGGRLNLGYSIEEISNLTPLDLKPEFTAESFAKMVEPLRKGEKQKIQFETVHRRKDGSLYDVEVHLQLSTYQNTLVFVAIILDITQRKKMENELGESELRLREMAENIKSVFWIEDTEGNLLYTSPAYEQVWGRTCQSFYENPKSWLDAIHPDDRQRVADSFAEWTLVGEYTEEFRITRPDGEIRWIYDRGYPIKNKIGEVYRIAGMAEDITERKKMEETFLQSEKLRSIGTITAGISHEFNNILAIISGNVQLLENTNKDNENLMDALRTIKMAIDDGAEISSNMLKFTTTNRDTEEYVSSDIRDFIIQSIDFTKPRWKNEAQVNGINYKMDTEGMKSVSPILCNSTELREVFINIIINALDAMPEGGSISFNTWRGDDTVFVSISDTGDGMSEEVKKNIFDPYFTTKAPVGTGLGMSVAYGIVTRHGGMIEVESELGKGSTFTLQFPTSNKKVSLKAIPKPEQETNEKNLRILVVDDEEAICNILDKFLSSSGHKVKIVDNGSDAINIIKTENFDLVLCDLSMPDVYGFEVIKAINELEKRPKIGIITGWREKLKPIEEEDMEFDFILKKPFDLSALSKHINVAFGVESRW